MLLTLISGLTVTDRRVCYQNKCSGDVKALPGCFRDGAKSRVLNGANFTSDSMTQADCFEFCSELAPGAPYQYAGVEDAKQCFCGNAIAANSSKGPDWCDSPGPCAPVCKNPDPKTPFDRPCCCPGNSSESCGGIGALFAFDIKDFSCKVERLSDAYCDSSIPISARLDDLIGKMTTTEKISCLTTKNCAISRLGIQAHFAEALHGLRYDCATDIQGRDDPLCATSFPHAQLLAASFNQSLWQTIGYSIATEARAFYNLWSSGAQSTSRYAQSFFAPDINLCRDPRWGRCLEVPGECPVLTSQYAMGYVRGMQTTKKGSNFSMTVCMAKHWSAYDVENGYTRNGTKYGRGYFNAAIPRRDLIETYWPQFRAAARGANLGGVMCSYNAVNGVPSCANGVFNNKVLRGDFGFDGTIVSDCSAIRGMEPQSHNFTPTPEKAAAVGLKGGTDLNCGTTYIQYMQDALDAGDVAESDIDQAVRRVLTQMFATGLGEADLPWADLGEADIDSKTHRQRALDAAIQGMVLLKNEGGLLPLRAKNGGKLRVAVIGPHYNSSTRLLANYYGKNVIVNTSTPLAGLSRRKELNVVAAVKGCDLVNVTEAPDLGGATDAAKQAEVAIVFIGLHSTQGGFPPNGPGMEREGFDRTNITLPGYQLPLVQAVVATGTPTVVVLINSGGLAAEWVYDNVPAVVEAYYPGELGGDAMAALLLGDKSPAGRLVTTIYPQDFVKERDITDMELRPHKDENGTDVPGVTYRFYDKALFPFGYGRSYTTFSFEWAGDNRLEATTAQVAAAIPAHFESKPTGLSAAKISVKNTGTVTSDVVVLCFASSKRTDAPLRQLVGFTRVGSLAPGATANAVVDIIPHALTTVSKDGHETVSADTLALSCGGEPDGFASGILTLTGPAQPIFSVPETM